MLRSVSLACGSLVLFVACSAGNDKGGPNPFDPTGGDGGLNVDGNTFDVHFDINSEGGEGGPVGDPETCEGAAAAKSYIGCDYWPTSIANNVWSIFDFAAIVANAGSTPATVTVTGQGGFSTTTTVAPNSLAKIYLPWNKTLKGDDADSCGQAVALSGSVRSDKGAYHLVASRPVTVYQFNALEYQGKGGASGKNWSACPGNSPCSLTFTPVGCFSFTNDASLLLPSTAMTGNYRVTAYHGWTAAGLGGSQPVNGAYFAITATADGTSVTVHAGSKGGTLAGGGVPAIPPGGSATISMNAGDVVELVGASDTNADLGGALVQADKPVQVLVGEPCIQVPIGQQACDHIEESVFPAETLGQHYFVTVPTGPLGNVVGHVVRIYGNVDGTTLTYNGAKPPGAPSTINHGDVADLGMVSRDFEISGNHEFAISTFMLGGSLLDPGAGTGKEEGDPSQSQMTAVEQYRKKTIFLAPDDYDISYADVVAQSGTTLTLDGAAVSASPQPISSGYSIWRIKLGPGVGGAHVLTGTQPFGIQVMGYGLYTSYQYPGGLDLSAIAPPPVK